MTDASDVKWTLWVFAGPGALSDSEESKGKVIPLAEAIGQLPAGVKVVAETVGTPTLLQRLTDEWPTQRLAGKAGGELTVQDSPAQRNLWRFLAWADEQTPKDSKRALIVLGDLLQAIGEAPKAAVPGVYRPPYPQQIKIKKPNINGKIAIQIWAKNTQARPRYGLCGNSYRYVSKTIDDWKADLDPTYGAPPDELCFGETITTTSGRSDLYYKLSKPNGSYVYTQGYYSPNLVDETSATLYTWNATGAVYSTIGEEENAGPNDKITMRRSIDAVGRADVDLTTRRADALVAALDGRHFDLLVSDDSDLVQITALRRLSPRTKVLLGARASRLHGGQPLLALLGAFREDAKLPPEPLAARTINACNQGAVALRSSGVRELLAALETLASQALATGEGSALRLCIDDTSRKGGDLASLTKALAKIDANAATQIEDSARKALIALSEPPQPTDAEPDLGIDLDGPGLQLGPPSNWTRLLDELSGQPDAKVARHTLEDLQALTARDRRVSRDARARTDQSAVVLEYPDPAGSVGEVGTRRDFERFVHSALERCDGVRHVTLMVRGKWTPTHPGSVLLDAELGTYLPMTTLARCLGNALSQRGHGPLAMLVFDDPELLRIENAYELRDHAYVLLTGVAEAQPPTRETMEARIREVVGIAERRAAKALAYTGASIAPFLHTWRRDTAVGLARLIVADEQGTVTLQGLDLRHIGALCLRFDSLCEQMLGNLDDPGTLTAAQQPRREPSATSVVQMINQIQVQGFGPFGEREGWTQTAKDLHNRWGELYNWICTSPTSISEAGAPLWINPNFTQDLDPDGYCTRLRVTIGAKQGKDYRRLSFHRSVRLYAMLTAASFLDRQEAQKLWGIVSLGLGYAPDRRLHQQLARLVDDRNAAHYFKTLDAPPLMRLSIEASAGEPGYDLRLTSSKSGAALIRKHSDVDLDIVDRSLQSLAYIMSRSSASREGWLYIESLGASLAEDVVNEALAQLERERETLMRGQHGRDAHLALALPPGLMRYPWELMRLPPQAPGMRPEMLSERFALGRQMWSDRTRQRIHQGDRVRVLLVADPPTSAPALPGARAEGIAIKALFEAMTRELDGDLAFECDAWIGESMTRAAMRQLMRNGNYDVLHFSGHGTFNAQQSDRSGWLLSDGLLNATELSNTLAWIENPPWLIFANGCDLGMINPGPSASYHGDVHGMADACIRAGVSAYIASLWRIHDDSARMLATNFYRSLLLERRTVGVALQHARIGVRKMWESLRGDVGLGDISWAGMVLYGNPTSRINDAPG